MISCFVTDSLCYRPIGYRENMRTIPADILHSLRGMWKTPGFTLVAIALIALSTGATTGIFELFNAVRLRMLPVRDPQQLVELRIDDMTHARGNWLRDASLTNPLWEEIRKHSQSFDGMFAWASESLEASPQGESQQINGLWVSGDFFRVLGVTPILGRTFSAQDDHRGCGLAPGAVISFKFWQQQFGGDKSVLGQALQVGAQRIQIIGVTPPDFFGLEVGRTFDVALPICSAPTLMDDKDRLDSGFTWWLTVMARRKPGATMNQTSAMWQVQSPQIFRATLPVAYPPDSVKPYLGMKLLAIPAGYGVSHMRDEYARPLEFLWALTALVLLIACVNLANLMLARATSRSRENAIRLAIGCSPSRILSYVFIEGSLLTLAGIAAGVVVAQALVHALTAFLNTGNDPVFLDVHPGFRLFAFSAALALFTCLFFSTLPALRAARTDAGDALRSGARTTAGRGSLLFRRALLSFQVAIALVLLVGSLLFAKTLWKLETLNPGFEPGAVLIADLNFSHLELSGPRNMTFRRQLLDEIRHTPGVASAAEMTIIPVTGADWNNRVWSDGSDLAHAHDAMRTMVGPGYFKTLTIPLLAGRDYTDQELATFSKVAVVNEELARELFGDKTAIGQHFHIERTPYEPETAYEIIGVVKDTKYHDLREENQPVMFMPLFKAAQWRPAARFAIRSKIDTSALAAELRSDFAKSQPSLRFSLRSFATMIQDSLLRERLMATLSSFFGALAIILTAVGVYGTVAYTVGLRHNEFGIRMTLGASRSTILALVMKETLSVVLIGFAVGLALALAAGRTAASLLFDLKATDGKTYALATCVLLILCALASYFPAIRGSSVNPIDALRTE